ncbi:MAG: hypothetical protein ACREFP_08455 [Acetobacteraceae bacterium]
MTLPKKAVEAFGAVTYFKVTVQEDHLVLRPARIGGGPEVREKLAELGITDKDIVAAVA